MSATLFWYLLETMSIVKLYNVFFNSMVLHRAGKAHNRRCSSLSNGSRRLLEPNFSSFFGLILDPFSKGNNSVLIRSPRFSDRCFKLFITIPTLRPSEGLSNCPHEQNASYCTIQTCVCLQERKEWLEYIVYSLQCIISHECLAPTECFKSN
jgi:hypothetical protein